ncbi:T-cell surface protein tactile-like isoform X1 [Pungitius pungitius]|uniref:T-cell surface protein tactile-like isoform X1 n=1 Tax=Pungitius pungitius TaxID=134920 RepID=UPI002E141E37
MLLMLLLTTLLFKGCRSQITGYGNKTADYGGDAHYSCSVADTTGVLQVTWQRVFKEKFVENLATYSERFGQQVNDPHAGKVIFTEASLRSTSITLRNVTWGDESCYVCSFNVYPDGSKRQQTCLTVQGQTSLVQCQHEVLAALGDNTYLSCRLIQSKDVVQVTWQKMIPGETKDVGSYDKHFGQKVNTGFQGRVEFKSDGLQNSSIVIRNVTDQDEGCYRCMFNIDPDGAFTGITCLQLYELHEPFLHVRESLSAEELVVSCSATGRPAPTVTLTVPHHNSTSVTNTNGTVTVTTTAVLSRLHDNSHRVGCAARVLSGRQIDVYEMIPEVTLSLPDGLDVKSGSDNSDLNVPLIIGLVVIVICVAAAAVIAFWLKQKHQNREPQRDPEDNKRDTNEPVTPLMNPELRQRISPHKSERINQPERSQHLKRNLFSNQPNPKEAEKESADGNS